MHSWIETVASSLTQQTATWFIGFVVALLGLFSGRIVETIRFSLNRADLRSKYFEELAVAVSHYVFVVDRLTKVYYRGSWSSAEAKSAIATEYDQVTNTLLQKEYVYRYWLQRYWNTLKVKAFAELMREVMAVDTELIRLNEIDAQKYSEQQLEPLDRAFKRLKVAADALLT
jgi:hypothetical protein